jgi:HupH hydrogenase expression protein, C-terminal conserved region
MNLRNIPIKIEDTEQYSIGNLRALLAEIATHLEKLVRDGTSGSIDLNSLPFAPGEYEQLRLLLGEGEATAHIEALGPSDIVETRYSGVWWVTHYNVEGDIVADSIEIATIPELLKSQPDDIGMGLELLKAQLNDEVKQ